MRLANVERVVEDVRKKIAEGDLADALDALNNVAVNGPRELADESVLLSARYAHASREERRGTVSPENVAVERRRITAAALALLTDLQRTLSSANAPVEPVAPRKPLPETLPRLERIVGVNNLKQIAWLEKGLRVSGAVCRVLTPTGLGSGFLISPQHMMTNHHVIPSEDAARHAKVEFNYQMSLEEPDAASGSVRYDLDPARFFQTSGVGELDFTVVAVQAHTSEAGTPLKTWGSVALNPNADPLPDEHVVIVQHPNGGPKQIVLTANAVIRVQPPMLHYSTDTMAGSSGSPVFNDLWQVIAIHHAEGPAIKRANGTIAHSNEGVLMSAIVPRLGHGWR